MKNFNFVISIWVLFFNLLLSQQYKNNPVMFSENLGMQIDADERKQYNLFPDLDGFHSANVFSESDSKFIIEYNINTKSGIVNKHVKISKEVFEMTLKHVNLTENYYKSSSFSIEKPCDEAEVIFNLGLKYAAQAKYKLTSQLFKTIVSDYSDCPAVFKVNKFIPDVNLLKKTKRGLFLNGGMLDREGRPEILIFSGYYGLWLGIATPIALKADSPQAIALGLLTGGPAAFYFTYTGTKNSNISDGRATMMMLGGHWGTWQGLGWGAIADMDGSNVVGISEITGLSGIAAAAVLSNRFDFTEGHASITNSAMPWGAWFGLMFGGIADHEGKTILKDMLIGSNVFMFGAGLAANNSEMSVNRVRMINLAGILGATFGFGLNLLMEVDNGQTAFTLVSATSAGGLIMGAKLTKDYDNSRNNKSEGSVSKIMLLNKKKWEISSNLKLHHKAFTENKQIPFMQLSLNF